MNDLLKNIKQFIDIDNKINEYNDNVSKLKNKKNEIEEKLEKYFLENKSNELKLSNGYSLVYQQNKIQPAISLKLLNQVLKTSIKNDNLIQQVLEQLKRKKIEETKYKNSIKYKKNE